MNGDVTAPQKGVPMRWVILALLFGSTVLNYLDRQMLSLLAPTIQRDLGMSDAAYANIVQAFLLAYTFAYLLAGRITDWLGARLSLALFVIWWSTANMLTGLVQGVGQLGAARFALGLGEAGNYTAAPKAVRQWFPPADRALAIGIYTAGSMVGATIAPPLIGFIALSWGWRPAFVVTGALGLVWTAAWLLIYRREPAADAAEQMASSLKGRALWGTILSDRSVWALICARMTTDPVWYFYLFWFPKYLSDERGMTLAGMAGTIWMIYLAADFGSLAGGWASGRLIKRGTAVEAARLRIATIAAAVAPIGGLIALHPGLTATFAIACAAVFAHLAWLISLGALIVDRYPASHMATVLGVIAAGSGLGGLLSTGLIGRLVTDHSYTPVFVALALTYPIGWLCLMAGGLNRPAQDRETAPLPAPSIHG